MRLVGQKKKEPKRKRKRAVEAEKIVTSTVNEDSAPTEESNTPESAGVFHFGDDEGAQEEFTGTDEPSGGEDPSEESYSDTCEDIKDTAPVESPENDDTLNESSSDPSTELEEVAATLEVAGKVPNEERYAESSEGVSPEEKSDDSEDAFFANESDDSDDIACGEVPLPESVDTISGDTALPQTGEEVSQLQPTSEADEEASLDAESSFEAEGEDAFEPEAEADTTAEEGVTPESEGEVEVEEEPSTEEASTSGALVEDIDFQYPKEEALEESPADAPYVPDWKDDDDEDDEDMPEEPEGFDGEPEEEETSHPQKKKKSSRRSKRKAAILDDDEVPEEEYVEPEPPEVQKHKKKVSIKDMFLSLLETSIAAAVFALVGYQVGGVVLGRLLENILGG